MKHPGSICWLQGMTGLSSLTMGFDVNTFEPHLKFWFQGFLEYHKPFSTLMWMWMVIHGLVVTSLDATGSLGSLSCIT